MAKYTVQVLDESGATVYTKTVGMGNMTGWLEQEELDEVQGALHLAQKKKFCPFDCDYCRA